MGFSQENGYEVVSMNAMMNALMLKINDQFGLEYTTETFLGTNYYKYFYALAQRMQENEVKTSEIFLKLEQYIDVVNARISRPVNTNPGIIEKFLAEGYTASVKPMIEADAGKIHICVDVNDGVHAEGTVTITNFANLVSGTDDGIQVGATVFVAQTGSVTPGGATFQAASSNALTAQSLADQINAHAVASLVVRAYVLGAVVTIKALQGGTGGNSIALLYDENDSNVGATVTGAGTLTGGVTNALYADIKTAICLLISQITVGGVVTQGLESEAVVLSNGQSFDFKYSLPNRIDVLLKLTITLSENNQTVIGDPDDVKNTLIDQIAQRYSLGKNFEPQKYFSVSDAPWASQVLLEYSFDEGATWSSDVYDADFDDLFTFGLADITIVEE